MSKFKDGGTVTRIADTRGMGKAVQSIPKPTPDSIERFNRFALKMRKEIEGNAAKGDWTVHGEELGVREIEHHVEKMRKAREVGDRDAYFEHLADIANSAMIAANGAGFLEPDEVIVSSTWSCYDDYWGKR